MTFIWPVDMHGYLFADIICSEKRTLLGERSSRKPGSFEAGDSKLTFISFAVEDKHLLFGISFAMIAEQSTRT